MRFVKTVENLFGLPQGFTRVEYLQSDGNQYIDTGYKANNTTKVEIKTQGQTWTFGGRTSLAVGDALGICFNANLVALQFGSQSINYNQTGIAQQVSECVISQDGAYINGVLRASFTEETFSSPRNLYLFNINNNGSLGGGLNGKMWYCRVWDNGSLIHNFIPCIDPFGVVCMYDIVDKKPYYNQGTGTFTAGRQIIPVEYLEGTGTQYIDTGLDYFADFEIGIQLRTNVSNKALGNGAFCCMQRYNAANPYWYFTTGSGTSNSYNSSTPITEHHVMKWKDNKIYSDDVLLTEFTKNSNTPNRMYLYAIGTSNKYPNVIYFCKLWNPADGTLVRDFVPCKDENDNGFLFDKVSGTCYLNSGTGDFVVGENKYKTKLRLIREVGRVPAGCKEVEYLQSTGTQRIDTGIPFIAQDNYVIKARSVNFDTSKRSIIISNYIAYNQYSALSLEWWAGSSANNGKARAYCVTKTGTSGASIASNDALSINVPHDLELNYSRTNNSILLKWDGNTKTNALNAEGLPNYSGSFCLFLDERPDPSAIQNPTRIYYLQIYHNNTLVRDMIPVLDWNMTPCMYDKVSGQLFYNAGSGNFVAGRQIHPGEYLESTGTQWIDTGIIPTSTTETKMGVEILSIPTTLVCFGGTDIPNNLQATYAILRKETGASDFNFRINYNNTIYCPLQINRKYDIVMNEYGSRNLIVDNNVIGTFTGTISVNIPIYLFSRNSNGTAQTQYSLNTRLYYFSIKDSAGKLVRDYIPAIDENGVGFMFDRVSHTCYLNNGTGSFLVGRPVCKVRFIKDVVPREYVAVNYIASSNGYQYINTGYTGNSATRVIIGASSSLTSSNIPLFGARDTNGYHNSFSIWQNVGANGMRFDYTDTTANVVYSHTWLTTGVNIIEKNGRYNYVNGVLVNSNTEKTFSCNNPFFLMSINTSGISMNGFVGSVSFCKIYENGTLVRNFVPVVRRIDKVAGMWDTVTKQFYGNSGTGNFNYG